MPSILAAKFGDDPQLSYQICDEFSIHQDSKYYNASVGCTLKLLLSSFLIMVSCKTFSEKLSSVKCVVFIHLLTHWTINEVFH